mmetsp:Transcript_16810/g.34484  ORF Transcript_16810/g.34484 Transcript_16810/m.34484 type:complete len:235 (-) Transcript_16810:61-765(-)
MAIPIFCHYGRHTLRHEVNTKTCNRSCAILAHLDSMIAHGKGIGYSDAGVRCPSTPVLFLPNCCKHTLELYVHVVVRHHTHVCLHQVGAESRHCIRIWLEELGLSLSERALRLDRSVRSDDDGREHVDGLIVGRGRRRRQTARPGVRPEAAEDVPADRTRHRRWVRGVQRPAVIIIGFGRSPCEGGWNSRTRSRTKSRPDGGGKGDSPPGCGGRYHCGGGQGGLWSVVGGTIFL